MNYPNSIFSAKSNHCYLLNSNQSKCPVVVIKLKVSRLKRFFHRMYYLFKCVPIFEFFGRIDWGSLCEIAHYVLPRAITIEILKTRLMNVENLLTDTRYECVRLNLFRARATVWFFFFYPYTFPPVHLSDGFRFCLQPTNNRPRWSRASSGPRRRRPSTYRRSRPNNWTWPRPTRCNGSTRDGCSPRRCSPSGYWCPRAAPQPGTRNCSRPPTRHCRKGNRLKNPWTPAWDSSTSEYSVTPARYGQCWNILGNVDISRKTMSKR